MPIHALDTGAPEAVFAFLDARVGPRGRTHWTWKYRLGAAEGPSAFYWEEANGEILGFIGLMRTALHDGARHHPAAWFVDWHVAPGERSVGVGLGLLRKAEAAAGILATLQGSPDTRQILPRLGWKQSCRTATWVRPLSPRFAGARAAASGRPWLRGPAMVAAAAARALFRVRPPRPPAGAALVDVARVPADYDRVWAVRAAEFPPLMRRDSDYVNYLCADYPDGGYRVQLARAGEETLGQVVWRLDRDRRGMQRGRIVDVLWPRRRPEMAAWMVQAACWQLQESGADYAECVVADADLEAAVRASRFRRRRVVPLWYHRLPGEASHPDRWYVTFLDCDRAYR